MKLTPEFEADIRQRGTESYERAALLGEIDRLRMRVSELEGITAFDSALQELEARGRVIEEQRRTIEALNSCIGGEGSTTTENVRLADEIERLRQSEREGWRYADELEQERKRLTAAIQHTLDENGHLADGENCTLIALKRAVGDWVEARNAPITGMFGIAERNALINAETLLENTFKE